MQYSSNISSDDSFLSSSLLLLSFFLLKSFYICPPGSHSPRHSSSHTIPLMLILRKRIEEGVVDVQSPEIDDRSLWKNEGPNSKHCLYNRKPEAEETTSSEEMWVVFVGYEWLLCGCCDVCCGCKGNNQSNHLSIR